MCIDALTDNWTLSKPRANCLAAVVVVVRRRSGGGGGGHRRAESFPLISFPLLCIACIKSQQHVRRKKKKKKKKEYKEEAILLHSAQR
jgi:hypothetical protein